MPRLRNEATGVVVSVSDATAATLGRDWQPVEAPKQEPAPKRRPTPKSK